MAAGCELRIPYGRGTHPAFPFHLLAFLKFRGISDAPNHPVLLVLLELAKVLGRIHHLTVLFADIGAGAVLPGILAELLVVQALVLAELADGPPVTVIRVLVQRPCELTLEPGLEGMLLSFPFAS